MQRQSQHNNDAGSNKLEKPFHVYLQCGIVMYTGEKYKSIHRLGFPPNSFLKHSLLKYDILYIK